MMLKLLLAVFLELDRIPAGCETGVGSEVRSHLFAVLFKRGEIKDSTAFTGFGGYLSRT